MRFETGRIEDFNFLAREWTLRRIICGGNFFDWSRFGIVVILFRWRFLRFVFVFEFTCSQTIDRTTFTQRRWQFTTAASTFLVANGNRSTILMRIAIIVANRWQRWLQFGISTSQRRYPAIVGWNAGTGRCVRMLMMAVLLWIARRWRHF